MDNIHKTPPSDRSPLTHKEAEPQGKLLALSTLLTVGGLGLVGLIGIGVKTGLFSIIGNAIGGVFTGLLGLIASNPVGWLIAGTIITSALILIGIFIAVGTLIRKKAAHLERLPTGQALQNKFDIPDTNTYQECSRLTNNLVNEISPIETLKILKDSLYIEENYSTEDFEQFIKKGTLPIQKSDTQTHSITRANMKTALRELTHLEEEVENISPQISYKCYIRFRCIDPQFPSKDDFPEEIKNIKNLNTLYELTQNPDYSFAEELYNEISLFNDSWQPPI